MKLEQGVRLAIAAMERRRWVFSAGNRLYIDGDTEPWVLEERAKWCELTDVIKIFKELLDEH